MDKDIFDCMGSFEWRGKKYTVIYSVEGCFRLINLFTKHINQVICFSFEEGIVFKMEGNSLVEMAKNTLIASTIIRDSAILFKLKLVPGIRIWRDVIVPVEYGKKVDFKIIGDLKKF